jgi:hypothetical protein
MPIPVSRDFVVEVWAQLLEGAEADLPAAVGALWKLRPGFSFYIYKSQGEWHQPGPLSPREALETSLAPAAPFTANFVPSSSLPRGGAVAATGAEAGAVSCTCGQPAVRFQSKKENSNKGKWFFTCADRKCGFFLWEEG